MLHTALEHIFMSIEEMPYGQLHDHLENYVDQKQLHLMLQEERRVDDAEIIKGKMRVVADTVFGADIIDTRVVERIVYAPIRELIDVAFGDIFNKFVDEIEKMFETACKQLKKPFNRYAIVTVVPHIGLRSKIVSLEIDLGEDIRHVYFNQRFPTGRYRADDDDKIRDLQSLLPNIG